MSASEQVREAEEAAVAALRAAEANQGRVAGDLKAAKARLSAITEQRDAELRAAGKEARSPVIAGAERDIEQQARDVANLTMQLKGARIGLEQAQAAIRALIEDPALASGFRERAERTSAEQADDARLLANVARRMADREKVLRREWRQANTGVDAEMFAAGRTEFGSTAAVDGREPGRSPRDFVEVNAKPLAVRLRHRRTVYDWTDLLSDLAGQLDGRDFLPASLLRGGRDNAASGWFTDSMGPSDRHSP